MRSRLLSASALAIVLAMAVQYNPTPALAGTPVTIDSFGMWTLEVLGYSDLVFPCEEEAESISVKYILPDGTAQGPDNWYLIHMDFVIELSPQSGEGFCTVGAATNNYPCALVEFGTTWQAGVLTIDWGTVDLLNGRVMHSTDSPYMSVSFSNYLQVSGVQPGLNVLSFYFEEWEDARITSLRILDSSGIEFTDASPPSLALELEVPDRAVGVGDTFTIGFLVSNGGDLPARDVVVRATYPEEALRILGNSSFRVPYLDTSAEGTFEFTALMEGRHEMLINLAARSGVAKPMARVEVPVGQRDWSSLAVPIGASVVLVLLASGVLTSRYGPRLWRLRRR